MRIWVSKLAEDPRPSESCEAAWPHPHSQDELRSAYLIASDAFVVYALDGHENVRVLHIGKNPPGGIEFGLP